VWCLNDVTTDLRRKRRCFLLTLLPDVFLCIGEGVGGGDRRPACSNDGDDDGCCCCCCCCDGLFIAESSPPLSCSLGSLAYKYNNTDVTMDKPAMN